MTKREIKRAARIYSLAVLANADTSCADTDDESNVAAEAIQRATDRLLLMRIEPGDVSTLRRCIEVARSDWLARAIDRAKKERTR